MKTTKKVSYVLGLAAIGLLTGCEKKPIMEPIPDKEFQSSVDVIYAMQVITDIDMACSYAVENDNEDPGCFFYHAPGSPAQNIVTVVRDNSLTHRGFNISFNDAICRDGHLRSGTIRIVFPSDNLNTRYYRDPEFYGKVALIDYRIDGWKVSLRNDFAVKNLAAITYDPQKTKLSWSLNGDFDFKHPSDPAKNMHCNVDLLKTLSNTSDRNVFPNRQSMIKWDLALTEYRGSVFGETSANVPFKYKIKDAEPMLRNFQCAPENVKSVPNTEAPRSHYQQSHPFINGVAEFTTSDKYPRVIYYGSEDGSAPSCDNSGVIMIKGISYPIDFVKEYNR